MALKQKIFSNMFLRNMLADLGERSAYSSSPGNYIPYFRYKIDKYQADYILYFPSEPFALRYKNEIFNKLCEYQGYDIIKFLEFHYGQFADKSDFLDFLIYEISERLKLSLGGTCRRKLETALCWTSEKKRQVFAEREQTVEAIFQNQSKVNSEAADNHVKSLCEKLNSHIERVMAETEKGIQELTGSFSSGNIQLNNRNHEEKIIQLLILLQQVQAPPQLARAEQLFKKCTASDIASILHLHFDAFRDNKLNTLQRKVADQSERIRANHPKVKNLAEALEQFFY